MVAAVIASVTVYTQPRCPSCTQTIRHLERRGISFETRPIDESIRQVAKRMGITTAPVVRVVTDAGDRWWGGFRPDRIDQLAGGAR